MSTLYTELLNIGFSPVLIFKNDNYPKVLYVQNNGRDIRLTINGVVTQPSFTLINQNKTLKLVTGGVRVHLAEPSQTA